MSSSTTLTTKAAKAVKVTKQTRTSKPVPGSSKSQEVVPQQTDATQSLECRELDAKAQSAIMPAPKPVKSKKRKWYKKPAKRGQSKAEQASNEPKRAGHLRAEDVVVEPALVTHAAGTATQGESVAVLKPKKSENPVEQVNEGPMQGDGTHPASFHAVRTAAQGDSAPTTKPKRSKRYSKPEKRQSKNTASVSPAGSAIADNVVGQAHLEPQAVNAAAQQGEAPTLKPAKAAKSTRRRYKTPVKKDSAPQGPSYLMSLPYDVRHLILDEAITPVETSVWDRHSRNRPFLVALPPLARTKNDRLRLESLLVTIAKSDFRIDSGGATEDFVNWLGRISFLPLHGDIAHKTGFDAVQALTFGKHDTHFRYERDFNYPGVSQLELAGRCKNLRFLTLKIANCDFTQEQKLGYSYMDRVPRTMPDLDTRFGFNNLFELRLFSLLRLKVLRKRVDEEGHVTVDEPTELALREVKAWLSGEFKRRGRRVEVDIVQTDDGDDWDC